MYRGFNIFIKSDCITSLTAGCLLHWGEVGRTTFFICCMMTNCKAFSKEHLLIHHTLMSVLHKANECSSVIKNNFSLLKLWSTFCSCSVEFKMLVQTLPANWLLISKVRGHYTECTACTKYFTVISAHGVKRLPLVYPWVCTVSLYQMLLNENWIC